MHACLALTLTLTLLAALAGGFELSQSAQAQGLSVSASKHNLTAGGPGPVKIVGRPGEVCTPCHTPHAANPVGPLWNRQDHGGYYLVYSSETITANIPQPSGSSRLCLSCHDGTIAIGQTNNPKNRVGGSPTITPQSSAYLGTDLRDDHPISFVYDSALAVKNPRLRDPMSLPKDLPLDREHRLQCTTCHDPHDNSRTYFLRMDNRASRLCTSCHNFKGWAMSAHAQASKSIGSVSSVAQPHWRKLKASSIRDLGCEACHRPHSAGGREWLLYQEAEQDNCLPCHNGSAGADVASQFLLFSRHPVEQGLHVHSPNEDPATMTMHVKCGDCHNPHEMASGPGSAAGASSTRNVPTPGGTKAPFLRPAMQGAYGANRIGRGASPAVYEYEVCNKCHGWRNPAKPVVYRVIDDPNIADLIQPSNLSYHPVAAQGKNMVVPSLLPPRHSTDFIYCTDCHTADSGARGPHGSHFAPLLMNNYTTIDNTGEGPQAYALCYTCHSRSSILANQSFPKHNLHIVKEKAPCSICHDPHGVVKNAHLINFDRERVTPAGKVGPTYVSLGFRKGSCTLTCHGKVHVNFQYHP